MVLSTVLIDPPTTLFGGAVLALVSMALVKRNGVSELWRVGQLSALWGAIYGASVGWHFFNRTDWMFCYLMDTANVPLVPVYLVFLFVCAAWALVGGVSVAALVHLGKVGLAWVAAASAAIGFGLFLYMTLDQYTHLGTTSDYWAGKAIATTADPAWVTASNVSAGVFGLAAVVIIALQVRRIRAS